MSSQSESSDKLQQDFIDEGAVTPRQLMIIGLCLFFNMLDGFDITAMAVVASSVSSELLLSADKLGWIFSFALIGMMAGGMILAPISDLIGRKKLIITALFLMGVSIIFTATATTLNEFIALRFISGLGAGAILASQAALAAEYSPEKYKALAVAVVTSGYPLGAMMTSIVADFILPDFGWRGMFWFGGLLTISMVSIAWAFVPESLQYLLIRRPAGALVEINKILKKLNKPIIDKLPRLKNQTTLNPSFFGGMLELLGNKHRLKTVMLWSAFLMIFSTLYFLMSWIPKLMEDAGFSAESGRMAFLRFNLGGVVGIYLIGWLSTKFRLTNLILCFAILASFTMVLFAIAPADLSILLPLTFVIGIVVQSAFTGLYSSSAKAYPTVIRTTGIGWAIGLGRIGAVIGPTAAGYLIAMGFGMESLYFVFAVPMVLGGFIAYCLYID